MKAWNYLFAPTLRRLKKDMVDFFRMQLNYGILGDLFYYAKKIGLNFNGNPDDVMSRYSQRAAGVDKKRNSKTEDALKPSYKIVFIGYSLPRFDNTSSEFRLHNLLHLLLECDCRIDYYYGTAFKDDSKYLKLLPGNINYIFKPQDSVEYLKEIALARPDFVWVSELWRMTYVDFVVNLMREVKSTCKDLKVIIDTVDFHYKEYYRKYQQTGEVADLTLANEYLSRETELYKMAEVVTVVTEDEKKDIEKNITGINRIEILPNIHNVPTSTRPYSKRRHICFLGNFGTSHNADAVRYFLEKIFPALLEADPMVEFHVLGYLSEMHRREFKQRNVKVIGGLKHLTKALSHYKLFVCPLTYGAGMKGKIGDAIIAGTPIVTTSLGAEGFRAEDGKEFFIADSPTEFAEKCIQALNDPVTWRYISSSAIKMIAEKYSPDIVKKELNKIFSEFAKTK